MNSSENGDCKESEEGVQRALNWLDDRAAERELEAEVGLRTEDRQNGGAENPVGITQGYCLAKHHTATEELRGESEGSFEKKNEELEKHEFEGREKGTQA
eukprot:3483650-Alexandrium_andersonii.AAC.1